MRMNANGQSKRGNRTGRPSTAASRNSAPGPLRRKRVYLVRAAGAVADALEDSRHVRHEDPLLARLRAGDAAAFRTLFQRHHASLVGVAKSIVRNRATAEDVVQDTWLAVMEGLARFEGRSSLKNWIFAILVNKARSRAVRDRRIAPAGSLTGEDEDDRSSADDAGGTWRNVPSVRDDITPERIVAGRQLLSHVEKAIDRLPEAQRLLLILREVEGIDTHDAETALGITNTNARVLLHRARTRIRQFAEELTAAPALTTIAARPKASPALTSAAPAIEQPA